MNKQLIKTMNALSVVVVLLLLHTNSQLKASTLIDSIPIHQSFTIQTSLNSELRTINVWTPPGYNSNTDSLMVIYMLDGGIEEDFSHVANTISKLILENKIKPLILVGIENTQRRRDLTGETEVKKDKKIAPVVGGSEQFRAFIQIELFPEINSRFRTTNKKGILGESLAGLFVTETFLLYPDMFDYYIAFDPSLWWNKKQLIKTAEEHLLKFPKNKKVFWFAGSSTKGISANVGKLADILKSKNLDSLKWYYSDEPNEKHNTIFQATKERAIIWALNQ